MNQFFIDEKTNLSLSKDDIKKCINWNNFSAIFLFKSDFLYSKTLRDNVFNILNFFWLDKLWINRFILVVDELNNNSIEYWSLSWEYNKMILNISNSDWLFINLEVIDTWNWKQAKTASQMEELRNDRLKKWFKDHEWIRWRWLFLIVTQLVDELYFRDDESWWLVVWIKKTFKKV